MDAPLDPTTADPRTLMQALLPAARTEYIRAWELLADPSTPLERRRRARERANAIADDHKVIADFLRGRESKLSGDDLHNARHLISELDRHTEALTRMASISVVGVTEAKDLRPEALGCGKRYRDPAKAGDGTDATRKAREGQGGQKPRDPRDRDRKKDQPFGDRGPKVDKSQLGTSKHDSQLADDMDPETRAKLEAMRQALESGQE